MYVLQRLLYCGLLGTQRTLMLSSPYVPFAGKALSQVRPSGQLEVVRLLNRSTILERGAVSQGRHRSLEGRHRFIEIRETRSTTQGKGTTVTQSMHMLAHADKPDAWSQQPHALQDGPIPARVQLRGAKDAANNARRGTLNYLLFHTESYTAYTSCYPLM